MSNIVYIPFADPNNPAQFVFLVAVITSVLTLQTIKHNIALQSRFFKHEWKDSCKNLDDKIESIRHYYRAETSIFLLNCIQLSQLLLINLIFARIILSGFSIFSSWLDIILVISGLFIFGIFWLLFFLVTELLNKKWLDKIMRKVLSMLPKLTHADGLDKEALNSFLNLPSLP